MKIKSAISLIFSLVFLASQPIHAVSELCFADINNRFVYFSESEDDKVWDSNLFHEYSNSANVLSFYSLTSIHTGWDSRNIEKVCFDIPRSSVPEFRYDENGIRQREYDEYYENRKVKSAEDILIGAFIPPDSHLWELYKENTRITSSITSTESIEADQVIKIVKEKAVLSEHDDTWVTVTKRYVKNNNEYVLSRTDIEFDIGKNGLYSMIEGIDLSTNVLVSTSPFWLSLADGTDNNIYYSVASALSLYGYDSKNVQLPMIRRHPEGKCSFIYTLNGLSDNKSEHKPQYEFRYIINPDVYFSAPDDWNGIIDYHFLVDYDTVEAQYSHSGTDIVKGDYNNYQPVRFRCNIVIANPGVEYPSIAPKTGTPIVPLAVTATTALAATVVILKKKRVKYTR